MIAQQQEAMKRARDRQRKNRRYSRWVPTIGNPNQHFCMHKNIMFAGIVIWVMTFAYMINACFVYAEKP